MANIVETHDPTGRLTSRRYEDWSSGEIEILGAVEMFQYVPVDNVAPMIVAEAAAETPFPVSDPPNIHKLAFSSPTQGLDSAQQACEVLKYVPFLGPFMAGSCTVTGIAVGAIGAYAWLSRLAESSWAIYFRGTLLTILTAGAAEVFMENAKRAVRDQVRIRKAG